ncbi:MAG: hypothetical protein OXU61_05365, partial [Gammaproteobacteria bacterium]|nr:hypothetical protein [Gammaproteobacteria bacterium]
HSHVTTSSFRRKPESRIEGARFALLLREGRPPGAAMCAFRAVFARDSGFRRNDRKKCRNDRKNAGMTGWVCRRCGLLAVCFKVDQAGGGR